MKYGVIAAGERNTAETAKELLTAGGNAFDAAVGAVFTSMTSEYALTSAGGGGAFLAWPVEKDPIVFDFFVDAPITPNGDQKEFFSTSVDFGTTQQIFHIGRGSVAVPGNVAGLLHVHAKLGALPIDRVFEPAIEAARNGITLNGAQAYAIQILEPILCHDPQNKALFYRDENNTVKPGDKFRNPDFADFLEILANEGGSYFYTGDGAKKILDLLSTEGYVDREALSNYTVLEKNPLESTFCGKRLLTNPGPSTGGTLIAFYLSLLEKGGSLDSKTVTELTRAMNITSHARREYEDSYADNFAVRKINDPGGFSHYLDLFHNGCWIWPGNPTISGRGETTHVSILDSHGNAASVTTTNGEGCGYILPNTGIMLNNMLGEEDLNPNGFHSWKKQQRMSSMIAPTIVAGELGPELILGSGGSNRIRSAITQVIINIIHDKMDLTQAIHAPRFHLEKTDLHCEPELQMEGFDELPEEIAVNHWSEQNLFFGGVNAVTQDSAAGDPRRGGVGLVC